MHTFKNTSFLLGAMSESQFPTGPGSEVAFCGRSNAGKSSMLNVITSQKTLARTSNTPGRTRQINFFQVPNSPARLVDLPGYGYAKTSHTEQRQFAKITEQYIETRACLFGVIVLMDCKQMLKDTDMAFIEWNLTKQRKIHLVLSRSDRAKRNELRESLRALKKHFENFQDVSIQTFSAKTRDGLDTLHDWLTNTLGIEKR